MSGSMIEEGSEILVVNFISIIATSARVADERGERTFSPIPEMNSFSTAHDTASYAHECMELSSLKEESSAPFDEIADRSLSASSPGSISAAFFVSSSRII